MPEGGTVLVKAENVVVGAEPRPDEPQSGDGKYVRVIIRDTGAGIPPENLSRIFDPYFTTRRAGTGLGLAIAKNIVEGLGGSIAVQTKAGEGTDFRIELGNASTRTREPVNP